jgi:FlaA1/EpsC-like NDP-sugar epimerase
LRGEQVLWVGSPVRFPVLDRAGKIVLGVGVGYAIAVALFVVVRTSDRGPSSLMFVATFFVCVLILVAVVFRQRRSGLRSARYLVTDKRIVVTSTWFGQQMVRSATLDELAPPVAVVSGESTIGTIRFGKTFSLSILAAAISSLGQRTPLVLREIHDVARVRHIIAAAQTHTR